MKAIAKTNLFLRVLGKRQDGYHELENVFLPVPELHDDVELVGNGSLSFRVEGANVPSDAENLCLKAANAFCQASGMTLDVGIFLRKRIPVAAGLGGGSSDAAAVLLLLNEHYGFPLDSVQLHALASALGADVPFFLNPVTSLGRGIGNLLTPVSLNVHFSLIVVTPCFPLSVKWAFSHLPSKMPDAPCLDDFLNAAAGCSVLDFAKTCRNDLEEPVFKKFPLLCAMRDCLAGNGALSVHVSGSGPSLFAIADVADGMKIAELFHERYHTFPCPVVACL